MRSAMVADASSSGRNVAVAFAVTSRYCSHHALNMITARSNAPQLCSIVERDASSL